MSNALAFDGAELVEAAPHFLLGVLSDRARVDEDDRRRREIGGARIPGAVH